MWRTADWCYLRLHAGLAHPAPCYGERALASWVDRLRDLWGDLADGYVYFNNDANACAVRDADTFTSLATRSGLAHDVEG